MHEALKRGKGRLPALHAMPLGDFPDHMRGGACKDLEAERGDAVAEILEREILEHDIGTAAMSGALRADISGHQRIGPLVSIPGIGAQRAARLEIAATTAQQIAIGPDPPDPVDRTAR